jgi:hypothetical protein
LEAARERVLERRREERAAAEAAPRRLQEEDPFSLTPGPPRCGNVEAFVELAQAALAVDAPPDAPVTRLVVHVDAAALVGDGSGCCELEDGPVISPETARRLGCDAETVAQIDLDGLPVNLGRARRTVSPAQRRLLEARDGGSCVFPGCERRRHLQAHHRVHWLDGGQTDLANLALLCHQHHRLVHEGGYTIDDDPAGGLIFRNRSGLRIQTQPPKPPPGSLDQLLHDLTCSPAVLTG